jgi:hypothetical protein
LLRDAACDQNGSVTSGSLHFESRHDCLNERRHLSIRLAREFDAPVGVEPIE